MYSFPFHHSTDQTYSRKFVGLFGEPRSPKMLFFTEKTGFPKYFGAPPGNYKELSVQNQHYADVAASIQKVTEELLIGMANHLHEVTGLKRMCIAGAVVLDGVANARIQKGRHVAEFCMQPAVGVGGR